MSEPRITPKRLAVLQAAEASHFAEMGHSLTFEQQYRQKGGITIYRLFRPGCDYEVVTAATKPLVAAGWLTHEHASWRHGIGHVVLTAAGRNALGAAAASRGVGGEERNE